MKLPTVASLVELIVPHNTMGQWVRTYDRQQQWPETGRLLCQKDANQVAERIIELIKSEQFEEAQETPEIDPNLIRIAELEAKIRVYESVIDSAGIKLGIPVRKTKPKEEKKQ